MNLPFELKVSPEDVGCDDEYSGYEITYINVNEDTKTIYSVSYNYNWHCGDGCCSDTSTGESYNGEISDWVKKAILEKYSDYKFES